MIEKIKMVFGFLWGQKWKISLIQILIPLFILIQFPVDDLNDMITTQVSKLTGGRVYLQFDKLDLGFVPLSLTMEKMSLDLPGLSTLNINQLEVYPSVVNLLLQKPAGEIQAQGVFRGNLTASLSPGKKLENGAPSQDIEIDASQIQLAELRQFLRLPVAIRGRADLKAKGYLDLTFSAPPDISAELQSPDLELSSSTVNTVMGPLNLPDLKVSRLNFKGRLSNNQLLVEETNIGKETDEILGNVKGQLGLELKPMNGGVFPIMGNYNYKVDLRVKKSLEDRAKLFLMLVDAHKRPEGADSRFRFNIVGDARNGSFNINALQ